MAKFNHELTNSRSKIAQANREYYGEDWIALKNKFDTKCAVCRKVIKQGEQILWNRERKMTTHADYKYCS